MTFSHEEKSLIDGRECGRRVYSHVKESALTFLSMVIGPFMCKPLFFRHPEHVSNSTGSTGWHCIRQAWPQYGIPHPDHLAQQTRRVLTAKSAKNDNSLAATNAARNLLL